MRSGPDLVSRVRARAKGRRWGRPRVRARAVSCDVGTLTGGLLQNAAGSTFIDLDAVGSEPFIKCGSDLELRADGTATFSGTVASSQFTATNMFLTGALVWPNGGILSEFSTTMRIEAAGGTVGIGRSDDDLNFFQAGGASRQTVTGSRGSIAALTSLLSALEAYGLVVDSST